MANLPGIALGNELIAPPLLRIGGMAVFGLHLDIQAVVLPPRDREAKIINARDCESDGTPIAFIDRETGDSHPPAFPCQYQPGDILYVRETWRPTGVLATPYAYRADEDLLVLIGESGETLSLEYRWRPSIHMPKEAARLMLLTSQTATKKQCISLLRTLTLAKKSWKCILKDKLEDKGTRPGGYEGRRGNR